MGIKVIVALDGAVLPGGVIKKGMIRGCASNGMLCSIKELGLDNKFYTNIKNTDTTKEELMIVNKYNALTSEFIPELKTLNTKYNENFRT